MEKTTIIIADDHTIYRKGLAAHLLMNGYSRVKEAADEDELGVLVRGAAGGIIVLFDVWLGNRDATGAMARLLRQNPRLRFIVLTDRDEEKLALKCVRSGAAGFIHKAQPASEILRAIESVMAGTNYFNRRCVRLMAASIQSTRPEEAALPHLTLTEREYSVFLLLAGGLPNKEISHRLRLAEPTISTYKKHIFQKLNIKSPIELGVYAMKNKLL
ncbi:MAG: response regulator transcription factor [Spirochaetales bacterium]|nr:response regulator transcription factor [Spirochaetales bacterium]